MKPTPSSKHTALMLVACICCITTLGLYAYMYYSVGAATNRAVVADTLVQNNTFDTIHAENIKKLYQSTQDQRAGIFKHVIPSTNIVAFIETFESVGSEAGSSLKLSTISAGSPKDTPPAGMSLFHAHVDAQGSWSSIMQTLALTESLPYITMIDSVYIDKSSDNDSKATPGWHISFNVSLLNSLSTSSPQQ